VSTGNRDNLTPLARRWDELCRELETNPDLELTAEEFAPLLATYKALRSTGAHLDRGLCALMTILERQAISDDGDTDDADANLDHAAETFRQPE
jgi:hypothetical protein